MSEGMGKCLEEALRVGLDQRTKGINKYGVAIEDAIVTVDEIIRHAQEEVADASVYLAKMRDVIEEDREATRRQVYAEILAIIDHSPLALQEIREYIEGNTQQRRILTLHVQPSELVDFVRNGEKNLLTLSRSNHFPFKTAVKVVL